MKKTVFLLCLSILCLSACKNRQQTVAVTETDIPVANVTFSGDSAFQHVVRQCDFGPRIPGSEAHSLCADYIVTTFRNYGLTVQEQNPMLTTWDGQSFRARNIIASHRPEAADRILLCAHWDCRPWCDADADEKNHRQPVLGANDGASGVAVMLELSRQIDSIAPQLGVDFVCFDLEDYGVPYWASDKDPLDGSDWCLGSRYWAQHPHVEGYAARFGVLLDMVGGRGAEFRYEGYSLKYAQPVVIKIWEAARRIGKDAYFIAEDGGWATDDHVPVNELLGIPTADIIPHHMNTNSSFGPTWHTVDDTPVNISSATLQAVGQTLVQLLIHEK